MERQLGAGGMMATGNTVLDTPDKEEEKENVK